MTPARRTCHHSYLYEGGTGMPFPPQPVITQDNLVVNIDTVIYYHPADD